MNVERYAKILTANDTGTTRSHQAGIHIPKGQRDLIAMLPPLDAREKNPDREIDLIDEEGAVWTVRYIWYNNRLHDAGGTRDEYRVTRIRELMRSRSVRPGDEMRIWRAEDGEYRVEFIPDSVPAADDDAATVVAASRIRLTGWRRVH